MGAFGDFMLGTPDKLEKIRTGTKQQDKLHNNILGQAMGMQRPGGGYDLAQNYYNNFLGGNQQEAFGQFSQPYMNQFNEQILPQIAERFAGMGALSSSGFGQAVGGAASGLQSQLAQLFSQLQGQAAQQQYGQYNQLTQTGLNHQQFGYNNREGSQGFAGPFLGQIGESASKPIGNALGGGITSLLGKLFGNGGGSSGIGSTVLGGVGTAMGGPVGGGIGSLIGKLFGM